LHRAIHYTEFFRKKSKDYSSVYLKMANAFSYHLNKRSIEIYPDEILVGTHTENRLGAICQPELTGGFMLEDLFRFEKRKTNPISIPKDKKWKLFFVMLYWSTRNLAFKAFPFWKRVRYISDQLSAVKYIINEAGGIAHFLPNYENILQKGTSGLKKDIEKVKKSKKLGESELDFLNSQIIVLEALENFSDRYRKLAIEKGRTDIAIVLKNSPKYPAKNLTEALQTIWFFQMAIQIESLDQGISLGRIDQYLYPIYLSEKKSGNFDEGKVKDTLCAFSLKLSEIFPLFSNRITEYFGGFPIGQAITLGGVDSKGKDLSNELTAIFLKVLDAFPTRQPNWHARFSKSSKESYKEKVFSVLKKGSGSPAIYNDDVIIPSLLKRGFPKKVVWNYSTVGCVEPAITGESVTSSDAALMNLPLALEILLGEGKRLNKNLFSKRFLKTKKLKNILSFEDFLIELESVVKVLISNLKEDLDYIEKANAKFHPVPFSSTTVTGCIENAKDLTEGGANYNASGIQGVGLADLADSVYSIYEFVFQRKDYSLGDFAKACKKNFKGFEKMRARILQLPKFGNDHKPCDEIAKKLATIFDRLISENKNTRGGNWMPGLYSMTCHRAFGKRMPALPSGRLKGESLSNGISPTDGVDRLGPTAMFHSVTSIDHSVFANGVNLNVKFDYDIINDNPSILSILIEGYFQSGGMQLQVNILKPEVLQDAILHPEKHRNLIVRISGYSSYFVDLSPKMQLEILNRTLQKMR
ncbi:MAG: formate acetyltransferase, partial [Leptospiraceae bacterium]|nr:formate acetyltransferase [Leptospiraceae bacterium]